MVTSQKFAPRGKLQGCLLCKRKTYNKHSFDFKFINEVKKFMSAISDKIFLQEVIENLNQNQLQAR